MANPVEIGNLSQLAFIQESIFGTTPATPVGQVLRWTGFTLAPEAAFIENPELRTDGMKAAGRRGAIRGKGEINGKLSAGTFDAFMAASLGNYGWTANVAKVAPIVVSTAASIAIDSVAKTFTRVSGSFVTDGFAVGQTVQTNGDTVNTTNNGVFVISGLSATVMTCSTASGLVTNATAAGFDIILVIRPSFTVEAGYRVNGNYIPYLGCVVDGCELSGKINQAVDIKFPLLVKQTQNESAATLFSSLTAVNTNPLITSWEGTITKAGATLGTVVAWDLKIARNCDVADVCGSPDLYDIQPKTTRITGTLELYFDSIQLYTDFRAENNVVLQFNLGGVSSLGYQFLMSKVRITKWGTAPKDGMMTQKVDFESYAPDSGSATSLQITRLP